jgi:hypothetical protein
MRRRVATRTSLDPPTVGLPRAAEILNDGTATLTDVTSASNRARIGGGLANIGTMTLDDVRLRGNTARVVIGLFSGQSVRLLTSRPPARSHAITTPPPDRAETT